MDEITLKRFAITQAVKPRISKKFTRVLLRNRSMKNFDSKSSSSRSVSVCIAVEEKKNIKAHLYICTDDTCRLVDYYSTATSRQILVDSC